MMKLGILIVVNFSFKMEKQIYIFYWFTANENKIVVNP